MSQVVVRFAPSPTGYLHIGNARAALFNALYAQHHHGRFILRLDDTDQERSTEVFAQSILQDLAWLGLTHHALFRQSERLDRYQQIVQILKSQGRLYPCYETPEELDLKRKQQLARKRPPLYDRAALRLTDAQKQAYEQEGRRPHWRFLLEDRVIGWHDLLRGPITFQGKNLSDPVLLRAEGQPVYTLASVVDDQDMGITHIIRGEDHISNTAVQIQIWQALGKDVETFHFAHFPFIVDRAGAGFSKRTGSLSLATLRDRGIEPMAVCSVLAHLGSSQDIRPYADLKMLAQDFHLEHISKTPPHFEEEMLIHMNHAWYRSMSYVHLQDRFQACGMLWTEKAWLLVRDNVTTFQDVDAWYQVLYGEIQPTPEDPNFLAVALDTLNTVLSYTGSSALDIDALWASWIPLLKKETKLQGAGLFKPLRRALTGWEHGPELKPLIALMGVDKVRERFAAACQRG